MKKVILSLLAIVSLTVISCKNEAKTDVKTTTEQGKELAMANFGVRGNCGMCKATIEKEQKEPECARGKTLGIWPHFEDERQVR